jgi:hypothetical protein
MTSFLDRAAALAESSSTNYESNVVVHDEETMGPPPVLITADDDGTQYLNDHLTHFFNTRTYESIKGVSQADKNRYFEFLTNHEALITKIFGNGVLNATTFLPVALRKGVDTDLVQEYKTWLENK